MKTFLDHLPGVAHRFTPSSEDHFILLQSGSGGSCQSKQTDGKGRGGNLHHVPVT